MFLTRPSVRLPSVIKFVNTIFWKRMNRFWCHKWSMWQGQETMSKYCFLPCDAMHKRSYSRHAVSVRPSVTFVSCAKTNKDIFDFFSPSGSQAILVVLCQTGWRYSDGNPPNEGVKCRSGIGRNRDSGLTVGYRRLLDVRSAKNIYWRRSWVYDTVGHAPLAIHRLLDVRTTKWQKHFFSYACHLP